MDLLPTPEQLEIVSSASAFLRGLLPPGRLRVLAEAGPAPDPDAWRHAAELGWFGLGLDEPSGGVGYTLVEEVLLHREIGRALAPGPYLATALGARVAARAGEARAAAAILAGSAVVGLAVPAGGARVGEASWGRFLLVDATGAELVVAADPGGAALLEVSVIGAPAPLSCIDPLVTLAAVDLEGALACAWVPAVVEPVWLRGALLAGAALVGIAEATRDASVGYCKAREQFGRPIGAFQAVKHRCADMAVRAEATFALVVLAALAMQANRSGAGTLCHAAKALAAEAALANAADNIQNHGAIGFTAEHHAHLYLKRARVLERVLGSTRGHLDAVLRGVPLVGAASG